jgi:hypothetical protein
MQSRRINSILWMLAAALATGAAVTLALGALLPLEIDPTSAETATRPNGRQSATAPAPELAAFETILQKPLRQSLTDSPTSMPAEAATPSGQITLAGTIGISLALLRRADGSIEVKAVGETIDGAEVLAVRPGEVELRSGGETMTLRKPKETEP